MRLFPAVLACLSLSGSPIAAQTLGPLSATDTTVVMTNSPAAAGGSIALFSSTTGTCSSASNRLALAPGSASTVTAETTTILTLVSSVPAGQTVCAVVTPVGAPAMAATAPVTVSPVPAISPAPTVNNPLVKITTPLPALTGESIALFSVAAPAAGGAAPVCSAASTPAPLEPYTGHVVIAGGETAVTLHTAPALGQLICAVISPAPGGGAGPTFTTAAVAVAAASAVPAAAAPVSPSLAPVSAIDTTVVLNNATAAAGGTIALFSATPPAACSSASTPVPLKAGTPGVVAAGKATTLTLSAPIAAGQSVCAVITPAGPGAMALAATASVTVSVPPAINPAPLDGDTTLTLTTAPAQPGDNIAIYSVAVPAAGAAAPVCSASSTPIPLATNTASTVLAGAQTAVTLKAPLAQGQIICAVLSSPAGAAAPHTYTTAQNAVGAPASPPGYDWGLVRAYFTLGALISQSDSEFSHEDLFLAFDIDKSYLPFKLKDKTTSTYYPFHPGINSFFEVRLTALPVAVQPCTPSATVTCSSTSTSTPVAPTASSDTFLNSQKSARLEFGLYAPFLLHEWHVATRTGGQATSTPYALFAAPLIKTGFDTALNGLNQTQQSNSTPSSVQPIGLSNEFYKFYDYGFRLGHYQLTSDQDVAPSVISYLDVTWGRFGNLASLLCPAAEYTGNNTCTAAAGTLPWARDTRLNVEGLFEIPATKGFSVGFSTNVAFDPLHLQGNSSIIHIRPADDLRFLFAYKFDIGTIAAKLAPHFSN